MKTQAPIVNSFGIMDCPHDQLLEITENAFHYFDDIIQMACDMGRDDVADELHYSICELDRVSHALRRGEILTTQERNDLRMTIKFTMKLVAGQLFPE